MKTIKTIALVISACFAFTICGCVSGCQMTEEKQHFVNVQPAQTNSLTGKNFSDEIYIWESFIFPTNRTTGVK